jgi:hypothetical protein
LFPSCVLYVLAASSQTLFKFCRGIWRNCWSAMQVLRCQNWQYSRSLSVEEMYSRVICLPTWKPKIIWYSGLPMWLVVNVSLVHKTLVYWLQQFISKV